MVHVDVQPGEGVAVFATGMFDCCIKNRQEPLLCENAMNLLHGYASVSTCASNFLLSPLPSVTMLSCFSITK